MSKDAWKRYSDKGSWYYDIVYPGFKYNMTDIMASLGLNQLKTLDSMIEKRRKLAGLYTEILSKVEGLTLPTEREGIKHSWLLYTILVDSKKLSRNELIEKLKEEGIGTSVHFIPLYKQSYYKNTLNYKEEDFPITEKVFSRIISLPLFPEMKEEEVNFVCQKISEFVK